MPYYFTAATILTMAPPFLILSYFSIRAVVTSWKGGDTRGAITELGFVAFLGVIMILAVLQAVHVDVSIEQLNRGLSELEGVLGGAR